MPSSQDITKMLHLISQGKKNLLDELVPIVYSELKNLASHSKRHERMGHTLNTTALVNEAYLKLVGHEKIDFESRAHFFGAAAKAMRQILIDYARKHSAAKRGHGQEKIPLDDLNLMAPEQTEEVLALEESLQKLEAIDERKAKIVELRYFTGLSITETAEILQTSIATIKRDWSFSKAWLFKDIKGV